eukprot:15431813-Alexandrium_andersonii.AAC.1
MPDLARGGVDWGCFRLTYKSVGTRMGYQARCPFHQKTKATGCKKFIAMTSDSLQHRRECFLRLLQWCDRALIYSRQRAHVAWTPALADCDAFAQLAARRVDDGPVGPTPTDEELDAWEGAFPPDPVATSVAAAAPAASSASSAAALVSARGRGQRGRGANAKARGKAQGRSRGPNRGRGATLEFEESSKSSSSTSSSSSD